jgi:hypothetical protein
VVRPGVAVGGDDGQRSARRAHGPTVSTIVD